jgi:hypothetical protein
MSLSTGRCLLKSNADLATVKSMYFALILAVFAATDGGFAEAVAQLPKSIKELHQLKQELVGTGCVSKVRSIEEKAATLLIKTCEEPAFACTKPNFAKMLHLYACVLSGKSAIKRPEQVRLLLSIRDSFLAPRLHRQGVIYPSERTESLGSAALTSENSPFAMVPSNAYLKRQINLLLPKDEAAYLWVEEAYLNAFSGEYLSSWEFKKPYNLAQQFLEKYSTSPYA